MRKGTGARGLPLWGQGVGTTSGHYFSRDPILDSPNVRFDLAWALQVVALAQQKSPIHSTRVKHMLPAFEVPTLWALYDP